MEALKHLLNKENLSKNLVNSSKTNNIFPDFDSLTHSNLLGDLEEDELMRVENKLKQFCTTNYKDTKMFNHFIKNITDPSLFSIYILSECHQKQDNSIQFTSSLSEKRQKDFSLLIENFIIDNQKDILNSTSKDLSKQSKNKEIDNETSKSQLNGVNKITEKVKNCDKDAASKVKIGNDGVGSDSDESEDEDTMWDDWDDDDDARYIGSSDCISISTNHNSCKHSLRTFANNHSTLPSETFANNHSTLPSETFANNHSTPETLTKSSFPTSTSLLCAFSDWNSGIDEEIRNLPFGSPSTQCDDILIIMHSHGNDNDDLDKKIVKANSHWNQLYSSPLPNQSKLTKVCFEEVTDVLEYDDEGVERKGPWEEMARDASRFQRRIFTLHSTISPILLPEHRMKMLTYISQPCNYTQLSNFFKERNWNGNDIPELNWKWKGRVFCN